MSVPARERGERSRPGPTAVAPGSVVPWAVLLALSGLAWIVTVDQTHGLGIGSAGMGMALPYFLALWVVMMAAMMFPSVAPVAIAWARSLTRRTRGVDRALRLGSFVVGYLVSWAGFGLVVFAAVLGTQRLVEVSPAAAKLAGVVILASSGLYQLTPLKGACLRHCRSPMAQLLRYSSYRAPMRDLRVGLHHGTYCLGCCWGLMIVLVAVGVMDVPAMAGLAFVIFLEKGWRNGPALSKAVGFALVLLAGLAWFYPGLLPALRPTPMT